MVDFEDDFEAEQHEQYLYIIEHELGFVKIGIGKDPERRLRALQIGSPFKLWIRDTERPSYALQVERFLHKKFKKYHVRGEWFDIPEDELDFEIPTHVNTLGIPNKPVEITAGRDLTYAWARTFDRLVIALNQRSRYSNAIVDDLREQWQEAGDLGRDEEEPNVADRPPELEEMDEDAREPGEIRCTNCGFHYHHAEQACPTCGSDDAVEDTETGFPY